MMEPSPFLHAYFYNNWEFLVDTNFGLEQEWESKYSFTAGLNIFYHDLNFLR
jgi:hypothetical protein